MNILLISPNTLTTPYPVYPIGLDYVAGSIEAKHKVRIADLQIVSHDELATLLTTFAPDIIGIACRNIDTTDAGDRLFFLNNYAELVGWLRHRTKAVLVAGGSGFTIMPEQIFAKLGVDYGIIGEGERFGVLVEALAENREPSAIPGVFRTGETAAPPQPWQGSLLRRFRPDAPQTDFYMKNGGMLNLQSKRGCTFRCLYCPYPRIEGDTHRLIDPETVARTALQLEEAGAKYLFFTDSAFNSDIPHSLAVAQALKAAGLTIPWGAFFAPLRLPPDYFKAMADAGCQHAEFGTESMSAAMLRTYRKPFRPEEVIAAHQQAQAANLHVAHYLLLGGPGESTATVTETLDSLEQLDKAVFFFFIGLRIYPGTALYDIALAEGKIKLQDDLLIPVFYESDAITIEAITTLVTQRAARRANWLVGAGGSSVAALTRMMHQQGYIGPLWEFLIRSP
ncbi:MAG: lipid biosynthesis B12-binding/radical SAM protein [Desulfobulbus sp.]